MDSVPICISVLALYGIFSELPSGEKELFKLYPFYACEPEFHPVVYLSSSIDWINAYESKLPWLYIWNKPFNFMNNPSFIYLFIF